MIAIKPLSRRLAPHLKLARLRALQDAPAAFGRTYAEDSQLSDADWLKRAATWNSGARSVCYIAIDSPTDAVEVDDDPESAAAAPCGMIAGYFDDPAAPNYDPRPSVAAMWVAPLHRKSGLGTKLMSEVAQWARKLGAVELRLMVTSGNVAAIGFYQNCGFVFTGRTEPYPADPAIFEREMVKSLQNLR